MKNRWVGIVFGGLLIVAGFAGGAFLLMRRQHMGGSQQPAGGLTAITPQGQVLAADLNSDLPAGTAVQTVGPYRVALTLSPYPPVSFNAAAFDVAVTDASSGAAVSDATVTLDLTMPGMWMPANRPAAQPSEAGGYSAPGRFTMRGEWWIEVVIERAGEKHSAFFSVWL